MFKGSCLFQTIILGIHVRFRECTNSYHFHFNFTNLISAIPIPSTNSIPNIWATKRHLTLWNQHVQTLHLSHHRALGEHGNLLQSCHFSLPSNFQSSLLWGVLHLGVSKNNATPKSSILYNRVFHYFHHPFWGFSPWFWKHPYFIGWPKIKSPRWQETPDHHSCHLQEWTCAVDSNGLGQVGPVFLSLRKRTNKEFTQLKIGRV